MTEESRPANYSPYPSRSHAYNAFPPEQAPQPQLQPPPQPQPQHPQRTAQPAGQQPPPRRTHAPARRRGPGWPALIIAMIVTALVTTTAVFGVWGMQSPFEPSGSGFDFRGDAPGANLQSDTEVVPRVEETARTPDWQAVAEAVRPATVSIMAEGESSAASGSGVIIDGAGHIITNHHVVSGALGGGQIKVTTNDGRLYDASVVGTDPTTDLAVLVFDEMPVHLVVARLGSSEDLEVAQPVMAIGAPLGLADTATTGIISALERPVAVQSSTDGMNPEEAEVVITNAIQIDASINPGNSGGPLFDAEGAVIGINSSIASISTSTTEAGSIGLGFAIPIDLVKSVAGQIIETGTVQHALLGVEIRTVAVSTASDSRLGAEVAAVSPGGAAHDAGLLEGDVITAIDGRPVTSGPALTGYVRRYRAGDEVTITLLRGGEEQRVNVVLQER